MSRRKRLAWPLIAALAGSGGLSLFYFGIVSLAESPEHALALFWEDRWIVLPIIFGFGVQAALYVILKRQLFIPVANTGPSTALTGASGGASTVAMAACCAHHASDVLPILGFTAAATFLAEYRIPFMLVGLGMTIVGIVVMLITLWRERHKAMQRLVLSTEAA
jgi:hypothetical protein